MIANDAPFNKFINAHGLYVGSTGTYVIDNFYIVQSSGGYMCRANCTKVSGGGLENDTLLLENGAGETGASRMETVSVIVRKIL